MLLIKGSLFVVHKYITGWLRNKLNVMKLQANIIMAMQLNIIYWEVKEPSSSDS